MAGASLLGVSTDDGTTQCDFAKSLDAPFPLIADADKRVAKSYGVLWPLLGLCRRVTYVIGSDQNIRAVFHRELDIGRHRDDVLRFVHDYCEGVRARAQAMWREALLDEK